MDKPKEKSKATRPRIGKAFSEEKQKQSQKQKQKVRVKFGPLNDYIASNSSIIEKEERQLKEELCAEGANNSKRSKISKGITNVKNMKRVKVIYQRILIRANNNFRNNKRRIIL